MGNIKNNSQISMKYAQWHYDCSSQNSVLNAKTLDLILK